MRGILLAGGSGTRLYPTTRSVSKQLLPVYDKPAVYYPLSTLMLAGIRDVLVISTERDTPLIRDLLGDGSQWGMKLSYKVQKKPEGIAQAFLIADDFIVNQKCCLILGDNLFYADSIETTLRKCMAREDGATILGYRVNQPEQFGVVEIDRDDRVVRLEEKPKTFISPWAVTGLYFYDRTVLEKAQRLKPSARGELEITDLNRMYLEEGKLNVEKLGRGVAWLDMGTPESLLSSSIFVETIERRQGLRIACLEEIALNKGFVTLNELKKTLESYPTSAYKAYLERIVNNPDMYLIQR
ncbi:MAG: glucose-1-phosphate thymidylyltransferase RfbA [Bdellovibrionota bacterium]